MLKRKKVREKGKIRFSEYFKKLKKGDKVAVKRELGAKGGIGFPKRLQGKTGKIIGERGKAYIVEIKDLSREKKFIIHPIHLKKIKTSQKAQIKISEKK